MRGNWDKLWWDGTNGDGWGSECPKYLLANNFFL